MPIATSPTFTPSSMPSQMTSSGAVPSEGMARIICNGGSIASSPRFERPDVTPSTTATVPPTARPSSTRCSDVRTWNRISPVLESSTEVAQTCDGGASTAAFTQPTALAYCHSAISRIGVTLRRTSDHGNALGMKRDRALPSPPVLSCLAVPPSLFCNCVSANATSLSDRRT